MAVPLIEWTKEE